jgi:hypothetical protein
MAINATAAPGEAVVGRSGLAQQAWIAITAANTSAELAIGTTSGLSVDFGDLAPLPARAGSAT